MGRTLSRVAGVVFAGALATFAAAPAALAQTETSTSPTETTTSTSETSTSETTTSDSPTSTTAPSPTSATTPSQRTNRDVRTTEKQVAPQAEPKIKGDTQEPAKDSGYPDNFGHGFVGSGGEGLLVVACAAGAPGNLATQYLTVTGGPDQDEANGLWNYSVRVVDAPAGTTTAKFSWTCGGIEGNGTVEFEQKEQPPTSTVTATATSTSTSTSTTTATPSSSAPASSTAPITTATSSTPAGNAAPKAQVKVAPKGGVETGFGGTAW